MNENDLLVIALVVFEMGFAFGAAYCIVNIFGKEIFDILKKMWYNIYRRIRKVFKKKSTEKVEKKNYI